MGTAGKKEKFYHKVDAADGAKEDHIPGLPIPVGDDRFTVYSQLLHPAGRERENTPIIFDLGGGAGQLVLEILPGGKPA